MATGAGRRLLAVLAACVAVAAVAYLPAIHLGYVWDDEQYVTHNEALRSWEGLTGIWLRPGTTKAYYPLTYSLFFLQHALWGIHPAGYHAVNVLLHGVTAAVLWLALARLGIPGAPLAALLFLAHPVHVESVAWVSELKNCLSAPLYVGALWAYLEGSQRRQAGRSAAWLSILAGVLYVLAMLAKVVTCTMPAAAAALVWARGGRLDRREASHVVVLLAVGGVFSLVAIHMEKALGAVGDTFVFSPAERVLIAGRAVWFYLGKLLWPSPIIFFYPRWTIDASHLRSWAWPAAAAAALVGLGLLSRRIGRWPLALAVAYVVTLAPALGFVSFWPMYFSYVADHFQYHASLYPIAGVAALMAVAVGRLPASGAGRRIPSMAGGAALVALLMSVTWREIPRFRNEITLWEDTLAKNPISWAPHNNLGVVLARAGLVDEALAHFRAAVALEPRSENARANLARAMAAVAAAPARDLDGRDVVLSGIGVGPSVLVFVRTDCPLSATYAPEIRRIATEYARHGVRFFVVLPEADLEAAAAREFLDAHQFGARAIPDPRHRLVSLARARVTPEAAIVEPDGRVVYTGRIDDGYVAVDRPRGAVTQRDLEAALQALVAGREVPAATGPAVGCAIAELMVAPRYRSSRKPTSDFTDRRRSAPPDGGLAREAP